MHARLGSETLRIRYRSALVWSGKMRGGDNRAFLDLFLFFAISGASFRDLVSCWLRAAADPSTVKRVRLISVGSELLLEAPSRLLSDLPLVVN